MRRLKMRCLARARRLAGKEGMGGPKKKKRTTREAWMEMTLSGGQDSAGNGNRRFALFLAAALGLGPGGFVAATMG